MEELFGNPAGKPHSETINATDTPRTRDVKFVRAKRLAYFTRGGHKNSPSTNNENSLSPTCKSSALNFIMNTKEQNQIFRLNDFQETNDEKNGIKLLAQKSSEPMFCGMKKETEAFRKVSSLELDYSLLENISVPEIQKLKYVMNWAQEFLKRNCEEENVQRSSFFPELLFQCDGNKKEPYFRTEETRNLPPTLPEWPYDYDLNAEADICNSISPSKNLNDTEKCTSFEFIGDTNFKNKYRKEKTVIGRIPLDSRETSVEPTIICQADSVRGNKSLINVISTTQDNYFWVPLEDSSDDECVGRALKTNKQITFCTESKDFSESKCNTLESERKHSSYLHSHIFESSVPSRKNLANMKEEWNGEKKYTTANNENVSKNFDSVLKTNSSPAKQYAADSIKRQYKNKHIAFTEESPFTNQVLEDITLDLMVPWQSIENRHKPIFSCGEKTCRTYEVKNLAEKEGTKNGANVAGFIEHNKVNDNNRDERQIDSRLSNKDSIFYDNSSALMIPSEGMLLKVCPKCSSENCLNINWCTECGCVLIGILPQPRKLRMDHTSEMIQNNLANDCTVSKAITEFSENSVISSEEFPKVKINASDHRIKCWEEDPEVNSNYDASVLEKYYFYLNQLNMAQNNNHEAESQSLHFKELITFSKEETFSRKPGKTFAHEKMSEQDVTQESNRSGYIDDEMELFGNKNINAQHEITHLKSQEIVGERSLSNSSFLHLLLDDLKESNETKTTRKKPLIDRKPIKAKHIKPKVTATKKYWEKSSLAWSSYTHGEVKPRSQYVQRSCSAEVGKRTAKGICQNVHPTGSNNTKKTKENPNQRLQSTGCHDTAQLKSSNHQATTVTYMNTFNACASSKQQCRTTCQDPEDALNKEIQREYAILSVWLLLPEELWINIFSFLSHKELSQAAQVCHRFRKIASDKTLWRKIQITNCHSLNDEWLISIGLRHPQSFALYRCHDEARGTTDEGLTQFFRNCKDSLKELNITNCSGPRFRGDTVLLYASTFCIHLSSVDISWTGTTDVGVIALAEASLSLQSLSVNGCKITDDAINVLVKKHRKSLNKLEVFGCHTLSEECLSYMASECSHLQTLNIG
ncbi:uncharacterized protein LOC115099247 isoform X2 [Rhinatrema bivittatum]|nr:uncharacterized protein LOC115099247 isoform X2 [Rhinatrema bivittatum]